MKNKAFITLIALIIFLNISLVMSVLVHKCLYGLKTLDNLYNNDFMVEEKEAMRNLVSYLKNKNENKHKTNLNIVKESEEEITISINDRLYVFKIEKDKIVEYRIVD